MNDSAPLIFIHYGPASYLRWTFQAARRSNPEKRIILLGDKKNQYFARGIAEFFFFEDYATGKAIEEFERVFQVIQGSRHWYTKEGGVETWLKFVFRRWFLINNFIKDQKINAFWTFDSDTLLLAPLAPREDRFHGYEATTQCRGECLNGWVGSQLLVERYICCINELFKDDAYLKAQRERLKTNINLAFNEMDAFREFCRRASIKTCQASNVIKGEAFDDALAMTDGYEIAGHRMLGRTNIKRLWISKNRNLYARKAANQTMVRLLSCNMSWMPDYFWKRLFHLTSPMSCKEETCEPSVDILYEVSLDLSKMMKIFRLLFPWVPQFKNQSRAVFFQLLEKTKRKFELSKMSS